MKSTAFMRALRSGRITASLILCALGLLLALIPDFSLKIFCIICGIVILALGIARLMLGAATNYLFDFSMLGGILLSLTGIFLLFRADSAIGFTGTVLGIVLLVFGISKIKGLWTAHRLGDSLSSFSIANAVLLCIAGILLLTQPLGTARTLTVILGIIIMAIAMLDIVTVVQAIKAVEKEEPTIIEGKFREI